MAVDSLRLVRFVAPYFEAAWPTVLLDLASRFRPRGQDIGAVIRGPSAGFRMNL